MPGNASGAAPLVTVNLVNFARRRVAAAPAPTVNLVNFTIPVPPATNR